jgi:hypothetical protein
VNSILVLRMARSQTWENLGLNGFDPRTAIEPAYETTSDGAVNYLAAAFAAVASSG